MEATFFDKTDVKSDTSNVNPVPHMTDACIMEIIDPLLTHNNVCGRTIAIIAVNTSKNGNPVVNFDNLSSTLLLFVGLVTGPYQGSIIDVLVATFESRNRRRQSQWKQR
jgi:hypothetical protein